VLDEDRMTDMFSKVKNEIGKVDVLVANVGWYSHAKQHLTLGQKQTKDWWLDVETNVRGTYLSIWYYLNTFTSNDESATGTIIIMSSGAATVVLPGQSSFGMSKLAMHRMVENVQAEYPNLRLFSLAPGIINTSDDFPEPYRMFALDTYDLVGGTTLWLSTPKADFLKGSWTSVNWDVEEMEAHKDEVEKNRLLKMRFLNADLSPKGHPFQS
jgi:NAD(P)-dependent dehydrogenase (short-subunit alcohol dehydrogenase family)